MRKATRDILFKSHKAYVLAIIVLKYSIPMPHQRKPVIQGRDNKLVTCPRLGFIQGSGGCLGQKCLRSMQLGDSLVIRGCFEDWRKSVKEYSGLMIDSFVNIFN